MDERNMSQACRAGDDAGELLPTLTEARWLLERWRLDYNHRRPHSALGYQAPAAYAAGLQSVRSPRPGGGPPGPRWRGWCRALRSVLGTSGGEERLSCHSGWTTKWRPVTVIHNFWVHSIGLWGPTVLQMTQGGLPPEN